MGKMCNLAAILVADIVGYSRLAGPVLRTPLHSDSALEIAISRWQ